MNTYVTSIKRVEKTILVTEVDDFCGDKFRFWFDEFPLPSIDSFFLSLNYYINSANGANSLESTRLN